MESKTSSFSATATQEASNYDEIFMQHSLHFADNLKELKNLSIQLYSAANHFELSYSREEQKKHLVVESLKDYITNAIVNTVDHLGSVADKVTNFLDEKVDEYSGTDLQFSCIEQRLRTYQDFTDRIGVSQQSLLIRTPKYYKKYITPDVQTIKVELEPDSSLFRKRHSSPETFSFSKIVSDKDPLETTKDSPTFFQLKRSGTLFRSSIISTHSKAKQPYPELLRRSASVSTSRGERSMTREIQPYSKKREPLIKALFTMLKQKKDGKL